MFYGLRTNYALASLGVDPVKVDMIQKHAAIGIGKAQSHTPQEVALMLLESLSPELVAGAKEITALDWAESRKINLDSEDVRSALLSLGWSEVLMLQYR